jgi:hypothetical protein
MKQETNKEMELMLRRLARRGGDRVPDNNGNLISEQHLDADEMNAYAEQALPDAARTRYTEHLADCVRCREIVVGLTASLGHPVLEKAKAPEQRSSVKNFLATLFSPMFARYAIPALALVGVVGIAVIVFRQGPASRNLTGSSPQSDVSTQVAQASPAPAVTDSYGDLNKQGKTVSDSAQGATVDSLTKDAPTTKAAEGSSAAAPAEAAPPPPMAQPKAGKPAAAEDEAGRREADADQKRPATVERQEQPADEATRGRDKETATTAKKDADDRTTTEYRPAKSAARRAPDANKNEVAKTASAPAPGAGGASVGQFAMEAEEKRKDAKEVRTVAGRRFQRDGNAWVDTAYAKGRATTNVSRGSEQYRALIADEPEIRTIAETLSGEVVVLWKGRAYRIE